MLFTTNEICHLYPDSLGAVTDDIPIHQVSTDSRIKMTHGLFVPLIGDKFNGHKFVDQAIENGAVAMFWDKDESLPNHIPNDFPIFFVDDAVEALQELAVDYQKKINPIVIGITGSNGKTTTKDLVASVLSMKYRIHKTKGNLNNHIGMPLTMLSMPLDTEILVLEMGMNHFGEIETLSDIAHPHYAVITNIGESHIEFLGSREGIAKAKAEILIGLQNEGKWYFDGDEPLLYPYEKRAISKRIGFGEDNAVNIQTLAMDNTGTTFLYEDQRYVIPLLGNHHVKNASYAIAIAQELGIDQATIQQGLSQLTMTGMRFESLIGMNKSTIINDTYNASPTSAKAAIEVVKSMQGYQRKIVVLGDMLELGEQTEAYHRDLAASISSEINIVCTIGEYARAISDTITLQNQGIAANHFDNKQALISYLHPLLDASTLILLKASRGMKLEEVCVQLLQR